MFSLVFCPCSYQLPSSLNCCAFLLLSSPIPHRRKTPPHTLDLVFERPYLNASLQQFDETPQHLDCSAPWNTRSSPFHFLMTPLLRYYLSAKQNCFFCCKFLSCNFKGRSFLSSETPSFPFSLVLIYLFQTLPHNLS